MKALPRFLPTPHELFGDGAPGFDPFLPRFDFIIDDLHELDVEALSRRQVSPFGRLALWVMRTARDEERLLRENEMFRRELHELSVVAPRDSARLLVYL